MTAQEYFGEWYKYLDQNELNKAIAKVKEEYKMGKVYPEYKNIFEAFRHCNHDRLKVVFIGMDPYPDGSATGIAFANEKDENLEKKPLSPSLQVLKDCLDRNYKSVHMFFDPTLIRWERQGVLLLNSSLTVRAHQPGSHAMIWRPFIASFLKELSKWQTGLIYVLMGDIAKTFKPYIGPFNDVIICKHPAYYARTGEQMPNVFERIDELTWSKNKEKITWL